MKDVLLIVQNKYIYIPLLTWIVIQLFKFIYEGIKTKKFNFKRMIGAGGMPSSHTAVVMSLSTMVGRDFGFDSVGFAISLVYACIVMYDASGVRRAAGEHATILNKIIDTNELSELQEQDKLVEVLGHTPLQVIVGGLIGIIVGVIFS